MKKITIILLVALMLVTSFVACGPDGGNPKDPVFVTQEIKADTTKIEIKCETKDPALIIFYSLDGKDPVPPTEYDASDETTTLGLIYIVSKGIPIEDVFALNTSEDKITIKALATIVKAGPGGATDISYLKSNIVEKTYKIPPND